MLILYWQECWSAQPDLGEDALAGEQLGAKTDHKSEHGQAAIPCLGEGNKTEAGSGLSHERSQALLQM